MSTCTEPGCDAPAAARVGTPQLPGPPLPGLGFLMIRPATTPVPTGLLLCLDHTHLAVDVMLLRATPERT
jgi:hypothetical protein